MTATDASGAEQGSDPIVFQVSRGGALNGTIDVALAFTGTATRGSDYTVTGVTGATLLPDGVTLRFAPGATVATLTLTPNDDSLAEGTESVFLTLGAGTGYTVGSPGSANASIVDNDALVAIAATDASGSETAPNPIVFTVSRTLSTAYQITVNLVWSGTATLGTDYTVTASGGTLSADKLQLTLAAGVASATLTVTPVNDPFYEGTETVIVTLGTGSGYSAGSPSSATGSITDNDTAPKISVSATQAVAIESPSQAGVYTITRSLNLNGAITVNLTFGGTAAAGRYTLSATGGATLIGTTQLTMPDGVATVTIRLTPIADGTPEPAQTAVLTIGSGTGYALGNPTSATVTLYDTNAPTISISPATVTIAGATTARTLTFTVSISGSSPTAASVLVATANGTAVAGVDYTSLSKTLTFSAGSITAQTVTVTVRGRAVGSVNKTFHRRPLEPDRRSDARRIDEHRHDHRHERAGRCGDRFLAERCGAAHHERPEPARHGRGAVLGRGRSRTGALRRRPLRDHGSVAARRDRLHGGQHHLHRREGGRLRLVRRPERELRRLRSGTARQRRGRAHRPLDRRPARARPHARPAGRLRLRRVHKPDAGDVADRRAAAPSCRRVRQAVDDLQSAGTADDRQQRLEAAAARAADVLRSGAASDTRGFTFRAVARSRAVYAGTRSGFSSSPKRARATN